MSALEVCGLSVSYGGVRALRDVSLAVRSGAIACILGANGAGKSSLLNAIVGLVPAAGGQVLHDGVDITTVPPYESARDGITLCPEGRRLFPDMSVLDNLRMGAYRLRSREEFRRRLHHAYELFPRLRERALQRAGSLSGGEQQMAAIARALMTAPKLLLLDEPSLGLAPKVIAEVARILLEIHASGITVVLVEQNAKLALRLSEYGYVLENGKLVLHGPSEVLLGDSYVKRIYLGERMETEPTCQST